MKSRQEVRIANWLTLAGIGWEHERPYPVDLSPPMTRAYQPDYYLPEADLYLGHFVTNLDASTAPNIDAARNTQAVTRKRAVYRRYGTRMLEAYTYHSQRAQSSHIMRGNSRSVGLRTNP